MLQEHELEEIDIDLFTLRIFLCVVRHGLQYCFSVFTQGVDDTLIMQCPFSIRQFELSAATLHCFPLEQTCWCVLPSKTLSFWPAS